MELQGEKWEAGVADSRCSSTACVMWRATSKHTALLGFKPTHMTSGTVEGGSVGVRGSEDDTRGSLLLNPFRTQSWVKHFATTQWLSSWTCRFFFDFVFWTLVHTSFSRLGINTPRHTRALKTLWSQWAQKYTLSHIYTQTHNTHRHKRQMDTERGGVMWGIGPSPCWLGPVWTDRAAWYRYDNQRNRLTTTAQHGKKTKKRTSCWNVQ